MVYLVWCAIEILVLIAARKAPPAWVGMKYTLALLFAPPVEG